MSTMIDLRYGLRMLGKNPGFTAAAVLTLALGIGANTIIFSVINGLFLHPSGIADPSHLFAIRVKYDKLNLKSIVISAPGFKDVEDSKQVFASAAASDEESFNYLAPEGPKRLKVAKVSAQWFDVFGTRPFLGRIFRPEEDQPKANHVALLAYDTWKSLFGGDPSTVGKTIQLNHEDYRVVGVMAPDFDWPRRTQLWIPLGLAASEFAPDNYFNELLFVVARSRPEVSPAQAEAYVELLTQRLIAEAARLKSSYPKDSGWGMFAVPFTEYTSGDLRTPMLILLGAVGFVLLIACSNIGGLLLARASTRTREFAVRIALGARKRDLLRQALAESFLLAAFGAIAGVAGAYSGVRFLLRWFPGTLSSRLVIPQAVDGQVLVFAALLMVVTGLFLGALPAAEVFGQRQYRILKEEARSVTSSHGRLRLRELLVVGQLAMALVLLVGAGLLLKTLTRMGRVSTGFDPRGVMTASVQLPENQYNNEEKLAAFYRAASEKLSVLPGVSSAALAVALPFTGFAPTSSFSIEGRPLGRGDPGPHSGLNWVTPGYFQALRIPLREGRYFTEDDRLGTQSVVIIDENLARQYWPNQDPIGQHLRRGGPWETIVGVVAHVMQSSLVGDSGKGVCYYPILQQPIQQAFLIVKTEGDATQLGGSMQAAVAAVDPAQPVADPKPLEEYLAASLSPQRIAASLVEVFSALALFLASIGLYGVISYSTAQRTQEIGIRMALGADDRQVLGMMIYQGLRLSLAGVLAGVVGASFVAQLLRSQLFEVGAFDPATFAAACLILLAVALAAVFIPARRAAKVDPMVALRYE